MNDRFKFRATFPVSYYDENGDDKDIKLTIYDVAVYSSGEIGFSAQQIETIINTLELPEIEQDTIWQFINDNYATSCYEWFVCDNAIIEQCTGLKDKNGNLIYEGDIVQYWWNQKTNTGTLFWNNEFARFCIANNETHCPEDSNCLMFVADKKIIEIIDNIHKQAEQKDK